MTFAESRGPHSSITVFANIIKQCAEFQKFCQVDPGNEAGALARVQYSIIAELPDDKTTEYIPLEDMQGERPFLVFHVNLSGLEFFSPATGQLQASGSVVLQFECDATDIQDAQYGDPLTNFDSKAEVYFWWLMRIGVIQKEFMEKAVLESQAFSLKQFGRPFRNDVSRAGKLAGLGDFFGSVCTVDWGQR